MATNKNLPKREDIDSQFKWKLEDVYSDISLSKALQF